MCSERLVHYPAFTRLYLLLRHDHDVKTCQYTCVCAETFPYGAFDPVPGYGSLHRLPGYGQSEPRKCLVVPARQDNKLRIPGAAGFLEYVLEIRRAVQSVLSLETAPFGQHGSGRQALPALGPARLQYLPPGFGAHANAKTVTAFPLDIAGLVCAFHQCSVKFPKIAGILLFYIPGCQRGGGDLWGQSKIATIGDEGRISDDFTLTPPIPASSGIACRHYLSTTPTKVGVQ